MNLRWAWIWSWQTAMVGRMAWWGVYMIFMCRLVCGGLGNCSSLQCWWCFWRSRLYVDLLFWLGYSVFARVSAYLLPSIPVWLEIHWRGLFVRSQSGELFSTYLGKLVFFGWIIAQDMYYSLRVIEEDDVMWVKMYVELRMTFFTVESSCLALVTITTFISVQKHYWVEAHGTLIVMVQNPVLPSIIHVKHEAATKGAHVADSKISKPMADWLYVRFHITLELTQKQKSDFIKSVVIVSV